MKSYEHFNRGELVLVTGGHQEGATGKVVSLTNAGFRGLEYAIQVAPDRILHGISAGHLRSLGWSGPHERWPHTGTIRRGVRVG